MQINITDRRVQETEAACEIVIVVDKNLDHRWVADREDLETLGFKGESEEAAFLPHQHRVYVGADSLDRDEIRLAVAKAIRTIEKTNYESLKIGSYTQNCPVTNTKAIVEGALLGSYRFDIYKSDKEEKKERMLIISLEDYSEKKLNLEPAKKAVDEAIEIIDATNMAKDIVNTPPQDMTPAKLAEKAVQIAAEFDDVTCFVGDEKFLEEQKMGAFLAVARASSNPPRLVHLIYKPENPKGKFAFVGKGLTYDSGGLSLKPSEYMVTMKSDKSGAAAALAILKGAAALKVPFEVHAIIGACENMIGGNAYKPDDILTAKNGTTIEVRNTDAEGRLVLADCLCYAQEQKPDYLFDLATLTGACVVALGEYTTGVMGHSSALKHEVVSSASKSGELASTLPFNRYLKKLLKSEIADISNISSSRYGGAITAALFLDRFIEEENKEKWVHLDIAGPAYVEKAWGYNKPGASGAGVRMCLYWLKEQQYKLENYHKKEK
ncbi:MAG: leucyl aminopeptidase [Campylobacteraceae bacterium 4484_4]|nr:MAG: leucyl aminopeptidase [Campylobacteraceae bacterium 4484_4]